MEPGHQEYNLEALAKVLKDMTPERRVGWAKSVHLHVGATYDDLISVIKFIMLHHPHNKQSREEFEREYGDTKELRGRFAKRSAQSQYSGKLDTLNDLILFRPDRMSGSRYRVSKFWSE